MYVCMYGCIYISLSLSLPLPRPFFVQVAASLSRSIPGRAAGGPVPGNGRKGRNLSPKRYTRWGV